MDFSRRYMWCFWRPIVLDVKKKLPNRRQFFLWYTRYDSNVRPSVPKTDALIHWATGAYDNYTTCKVQIVSGTISLHFVSLLRLLEKKIPTVLSFLHYTSPNPISFFVRAKNWGSHLYLNHYKISDMNFRYFIVARLYHDVRTEFEQEIWCKRA